MGSDQNVVPSFQVHITAQTNGSQVCDQGFLPNNFTRYASVVQATIPVTWYNIVNAYLQFGYSTREKQTMPNAKKLYDKNFFNVVQFNIPDGSYSVTDLCCVCSYNNYDMSFTLEYSTLTNKLRAVFNNYSQIYGLCLISTPLTTKIGFSLENAVQIPYGHINGRQGYVIDGYISTWSTSPYQYNGMTVNQLPVSNVRYTTLATHKLDLSGVRNIFVVPNFAMLNYAKQKVLAKIPVNVGFGSILLYNNFNGYRVKTFNSDVITSIQLTFLDADTGLEIDMQSCNWSVTIQFDFNAPDPDYQITTLPDKDLQPEHNDFQNEISQEGTDQTNLNNVTSDLNLIQLVDPNPYDISA